MTIKTEDGSVVAYASDGEFTGHLDSDSIGFEWSEENEVDETFQNENYFSISRITNFQGLSPNEIALNWKNAEEIHKLKEISGVGITQAIKLFRAGFESVKDIEEATQSELSQVDRIGNALAARIKADVDSIEVDDINAKKLVEELEQSHENETDEIKFSEKGTLMYGME